MEPIIVEIAVVGAGPAGLAAAVALAATGATVALIGVPASDNRTSALLASSVTALETLGVWESCADDAAPLAAMRIVDDTGRLLRAPELYFSASEIGLEAFGWNIENHRLVAALSEAIGRTSNIRSISRQARAVEFTDNHACITLDDGGEIQTRLIVAADGRRSLCRMAAHIETQAREYPQVALTMNFDHARPHRNVSTEFHTPHGPFTTVPLPGQRSSLVWVVSPDEAADLMALDEKRLSEEIERRAHSILGKVSAGTERARFPLGVETAERLGVHRLVLAGDAAHVLPPIGAQGFNLGLRDIATIAELVAQARRNGEDIGLETVTQAYHDSRQADVRSRTLAADMLNRTLLSDFLPMQALRGAGLYAVGRVAPLRRAVMREGVSPAFAQPRLMRGEAL